MLRRPRNPTPVIIGHRGAKGLASENTLSAVQRALDEAAQHVEIDVQRSADGVLVVIHDAHVDRTTTGHGRVASLSYAQLRSLPDRSGACGATHIPTLGDVIDLIKTSSAQLVVELKRPGRYPGMEAQLARLLQERGVRDRTVVISFDQQSLCRYRRAAPDARTGLLALWPGFSRSDAPDVLDVHWLGVVLRPQLIRRCHARQVNVWVWTVNNPWLMRLLHRLGVDGITTDRPDLAYRLFYGAVRRRRDTLVRRR